MMQLVLLVQTLCWWAVVLTASPCTVYDPKEHPKPGKPKNKTLQFFFVVYSQVALCRLRALSGMPRPPTPSPTPPPPSPALLPSATCCTVPEGWFPRVVGGRPKLGVLVAPLTTFLALQSCFPL